MAHGFDHTVVVGKEGTAGTKASAFSWLTILESFEPEENANVDQRKGIGQRTPMKLRTGARGYEGSFGGVLQNARPIFMALGKQSAPTGDATAGFTRTLTPIGKGETLPSFTFQHNIAEGTPLLRNYVGGKVDTLTVSAKAEEAVEVEGDMIFLNLDQTGTASAVTAELNNYYMFYEGTVKINNAQVANISEFELEISNNLEARFFVNGKDTAGKIEEGSLDLALSMTMDYESAVQFDLFKTGADIAVELTLQDIAEPKNSIKIVLSGGKYDTNAIGAGAEDVTEQEMEAVFTDITVTAKDVLTNLFA
ncbi:hypothetical protein [Bacillus phage Anath]|uniref:Uncharacterized protein n=1 Tax=Bacillus phage Anath TaxID=2108114 RepID=A0A2P1JUI4_9CAUD|nr:hypothetical protein [Bacillus phage Anath]